MQKIATVTVGAGGAASIDFTSIPSTYTDLYFEFTFRSDSAQSMAAYYIRLNGDTTASAHSGRALYGSGSGGGTSNNVSGTGVFIPYGDYANDGTGIFSVGSCYIPNYTGSATKQLQIEATSENNLTASYQAIISGAWTGTAAVNAIKLYPAAGNMVQYTTATLYGITAGSGGVSVA